MSFVMDKSKSKKVASVSKDLFYLTEDQMIYHLFEKRIINIKQVI